MLSVEGFQAFYGRSQALHDFSVQVAGGEVLCLLGRNGAGKTTALKAIMGLVRPRGGRISLDGDELTGLPPHEIPRRGIGYVPQGRRLFAELSVRENLEIGLMVRGSDNGVRERALDLFPVLRTRMDQKAGTLSGGEQTMLTIARALCIEPRVLLLDEPTEGLMPSMIATIRDVILRLRDDGVGVLLVEQRVDAVLPVASRVAFMENGRIRETVSIEAVRADDRLLHRYVGVGHAG